MKTKVILYFLFFISHAVFSQNTINFSNNIKVDYTSRKNLRYQDNYINQITNANGKLYVLGFFDTINSVKAKNIAFFDGVRWSKMDVGKDFEKGYFLISFNNQIYLSGQWGSTSGVKRIMPDGKWHFFGTGTSPTFTNNPIQIENKSIQLKINVMINYKGDLLCGGELMPIGSLNTNLIKWDGKSWSEIKPMKTYFGADITSMVEYNGEDKIGILDSSFNVTYFNCQKENNHKGLDYFRGSLVTSFCSGCRTDDVSKFFNR